MRLISTDLQMIIYPQFPVFCQKNVIDLFAQITAPKNSLSSSSELSTEFHSSFGIKFPADVEHKKPNKQIRSRNIREI